MGAESVVLYNLQYLWIYKFSVSLFCSSWRYALSFFVSEVHIPAHPVQCSNYIVVLEGLVLMYQQILVVYTLEAAVSDQLHDWMNTTL